MTGTVVAWIAIGAVAGVMHAAALWRTAHDWTGPPLATAWRLPAVAAVLVGAAFAGTLLPAVSGWAGGLAGTGAFLCLRSHRWTR
jgi:hypothetical protein